MANDDSDRKSRLEATTRTGKGYYDQVLALSEGIINDSFQNLYARYPDLGKLYLNDPFIGACEIDLNPPSIIIPSRAGLNFSKLLFVVNVKKGIIKDGDGLLEANLDGWKLAVEVDFDKIKIEDPSKVTDKKLREKMINENVWLKENFVPGDYTASRLFLKLSSSDWGKFDDQFSVAIDSDGQPSSVAVWAANNGITGMRLSFFLKTWAEKKDGSGKNTLGYHFQAPGGEAISAVPTYVPTALAHQIFPYKNPQKGATEGPSDDSSIGTSRNAFMYCEMVKDHPLPDDPKLVWSGNFITAPATLNDPGINATFLVSHQLFMATYLLPELQALNWALDIFHDPVTIRENPQNDNMLAVWIPYSVGNGADPTHNQQADPIFQWAPNNPDHPTGYTWTKFNAVSNYPQVASAIRPQGEARLVKAEAQSTNTVSWSPGGTQINISGVSWMHHRCEWARVNNPQNFSDLYGLLEERYDITWNIILNIIQESNGVLNIELDQSTQDGNVKVQRTSGSFNLTPESMEGLIEGFVEKNVKVCLPVTIANVKEKLKGNGKFVYPATGYLNFSNIMFNNEGGLLSEVAYKPFPPEAPLPTLPTSAMALQARISINRKTTVATQILVILTHKLSWEPLKSITKMALKKDTVFSFKGTNNTTDPILFKYITLEFTSDSIEGREIFANAAFHVVDDTNIPDPEPTENDKGGETGTTGGNATEEMGTTSDTASTEGTTEGGETMAVDKPASTSDATVKPHKPTLSDKLKAALGGGSASRSSDQPAEKPKLKPKITSTLKLTQSEDITNAELTAASKTEGNKTQWVVKISGKKDSILTVAPGGWFNVDVKGDTGVAGTYTLYIDEVWSDEKGNVTDHDPEPVQVVLT